MGYKPIKTDKPRPPPPKVVLKPIQCLGCGATHNKPVCPYCNRKYSL